MQLYLSSRLLDVCWIRVNWCQGKTPNLQLHCSRDFCVSLWMCSQLYLHIPQSHSHTAGRLVEVSVCLFEGCFQLFLQSHSQAVGRLMVYSCLHDCTEICNSFPTVQRSATAFLLAKKKKCSFAWTLFLWFCWCVVVSYHQLFLYMMKSIWSKCIIWLIHVVWSKCIIWLIHVV